MTEVIALQTVVSLLLALLMFAAYKDFCLDRFRGRAFAMRDILFDDAEKLGISRDSLAYVHLRDTFNVLIRFAHKITLARLIWFRAFTVGSTLDGKREQRWKVALEGLDKQAAAELERRRTLLFVHAMGFALERSPLILVVFPLYIAVRLSSRIMRSCLRVLYSMEPAMVTIETAAAMDSVGRPKHA